MYASMHVPSVAPERWDEFVIQEFIRHGPVLMNIKVPAPEMWGLQIGPKEWPFSTMWFKISLLYFGNFRHCKYLSSKAGGGRHTINLAVAV
jgi:hypothetical protein